MRVQNLTFFKCDDAGRAQLLAWYNETTNPKDEDEDGEAKQKPLYKGTFLKTYKNMLSEITSKGAAGRAGAVKVNTLNSANLASLHNQGAKQDMAAQLLKVFEHVNFFNLLILDSEQTNPTVRDQGSHLAWQIKSSADKFLRDGQNTYRSDQQNFQH